MKIIPFLWLWFHEISGDCRLRIKTGGRDESRADRHHQPYEPTPYVVLQRLAVTGHIGEDNVLVDYGCGKGRVPFFFAGRVGCRTIGIECDEAFFEAALANRYTAMRGQCSAISETKTTFLLEHAERWHIPREADRFFFFNPFSVEVLQQVLAQIREAHNAAPRRMLLCFYYPSEKYAAYLKTVKELALVDDIDCMDLFQDGDRRERILVFEFSLTGGDL